MSSYILLTFFTALMQVALYTFNNISTNLYINIHAFLAQHAYSAMHNINVHAYTFNQYDFVVVVYMQDILHIIMMCLHVDGSVSSVNVPFLLPRAGLDNGGSDFFVTFLPLPFTDSNDVGKLYITTPEHVPVTFIISVPGTGYFHRATVDPGEVKEFTFYGEDLVLRNTTDRSKGIIITVENGKQVFLYALQEDPNNNAPSSFLALPPHDLGAASYTYIAAMIHTLDRARFGSEFASGYIPRDIHALVGIVSAENDTLLTITPYHNVTIGTESVKAGESMDVTLHKAETLLIAFIGDLTGTKVTSNRPISFFCGDQCTNIPSGVPYCDHIVEQLPPVEAWGRRFATAPLKTRMSFDVFRFVASENGTTVNISCTLSNGTQGYVDAFTLNEGGFADVQVNSKDYCWMEADKSILLLQFAIGTTADSVPGDPFMALVPAVSHYTNSFTLPIVNSSLHSFTHYLNIIIPAEHYQPDQIFLDGQSLQSLALAFVSIVRNGETMAYASQVEVNATTHTLIHGNSRGLFGVVSYGFAPYVSYGHIGGMRLPHFSEFIPVPCSMQLYIY